MKYLMRGKIQKTIAVTMTAFLLLSDTETVTATKTDKNYVEINSEPNFSANKLLSKIKKKSDSNRDTEEYRYNNIIDEAEDIILNYIERLEAPKKQKINERKLSIKYKKLQVLTIILGIVTMTSIFISLIK
mgnify:CR=1 FL=1